MPAYVVLKDQKPVATGKTQSVYQHPDDPKQLIKIRNLAKLQRAYDRKIGGMIGFKRPHGLYTTWMRELQHYLSVRVRLGYHPPFLQEYHGLVDTDLGLGMVVGRVAGRSGALAPTLEDLVPGTGFTSDLRAKLDDMLRKMNELRISTNDVSARNIVYGWNDVMQDHLVLIEGIGVNTFIPITRYSNFLNVRSNNRHFASTIRVLEKLDLRRAQAAPAS